MKKWILKVREGRPQHTSDYQRADMQDWMRQNEGKLVEVIPRDKISQNKRGYFEGAIIPTYCHWHEALDEKNADHRDMVREMFKTEFNGVTIKGMWNEPRKVAKSTARLTNDQFGAFIERITRYFEQNEIPVPNPELYKSWQDMFATDYPNYWEWLEATNQQPDSLPKILK